MNDNQCLALLTALIHSRGRHLTISDSAREAVEIGRVFGITPQPLTDTPGIDPGLDAWNTEQMRAEEKRLLGVSYVPDPRD